MTALTFITLAVIAYGVFGSRGYSRALPLAAATPAGAAVAAGATAVPTFYAAALGSAVALALGSVGRVRTSAQRPDGLPPGVLPFVLFALWSTGVTLAAPYLFDGLMALKPGPTYWPLAAGVVSSSNTAQILYLWLAVCIVVHIARSPTVGPELLGTAAGLVTVLSLWRYSHVTLGVPFPEHLFDNSPAFTYIETLPGGLPRVRGILSEPAALAVSSLVTISYMLPRARDLSRARRTVALVVVAGALYLGVVSTSATFFVGGGTLAAIAGLWLGGGFLLRRVSMRAFVGVAGCAATIAMIWLLPLMTGFATAIINQKVQSSSYDQRSGSDAFAYELFFKSFGIGVGLGASRASSFLPSLLGSVGLPGTLLFVGTVVVLARRAAAVRSYHPVVWTLVALLVSKIISGPDLSDTSGILWLSLGLLSKAATQKKSTYLEVNPWPNDRLPDRAGSARTGTRSLPLSSSSPY